MSHDGPNQPMPLPEPRKADFPVGPDMVRPDNPPGPWNSRRYEAFLANLLHHWEQMARRTALRLIAHTRGRERDDQEKALLAYYQAGASYCSWCRHRWLAASPSRRMAWMEDLTSAAEQAANEQAAHLLGLNPGGRPTAGKDGGK